MILTRKQRLKLKEKFDQGPLTLYQSYHPRFYNSGVSDVAKEHFLRSGVFLSTEDGDEPVTYQEFRKKVYPVFCGDGAVMVPMHWYWLGIESDGYAHT